MFFRCRFVFLSTKRLFHSYRSMSSTTTISDETFFDPCTGCDIPCSKFTQYPTEISQQIDQGTMIGSVEKHRRHLCIGQSILPSQWPNDVKDTAGGYIKEITRLFREKKEEIGYSVKLTSASVVTHDPSADPSHTADWYLFPDQIKLTNVKVDQIEQVIQTLFIEDQSVIQIKDKTKSIDEQLKEEKNLPVFDAPIHCERLHGIWILVCCHYQRDQRCGVIGPILVNEFENYIRDHQNQNNQVHCLKISHIGGHKFAGNVIVYPSGTWYGRVLTCHVPLIVDAYTTSVETKEKLKPLLRGYLDTAW